MENDKNFRTHAISVFFAHTARSPHNGQHSLSLSCELHFHWINDRTHFLFLIEAKKKCFTSSVQSYNGKIFCWFIKNSFTSLSERRITSFQEFYGNNFQFNFNFNVKWNFLAILWIKINFYEFNFCTVIIMTISAHHQWMKRGFFNCTLFFSGVDYFLQCRGVVLKLLLRENYQREFCMKEVIHVFIIQALKAYVYYATNYLAFL